ncbi:MAG: HEAT repeat domain-containing protein [Elusimicrobia bacterium]|nr:HEAT repeat domain-containing protein [Elusimicrobiota bacterium]
MKFGHRGFWVLVFAVISGASAKSLPPNLYEWVKSSDAIFVGKTASQRTAPFPVEILTVLKGQVSPKALEWPLANGSDIHPPAPLLPDSTYVVIFNGRRTYVLPLSPKYEERNITMVKKLLDVSIMKTDFERDRAMFGLATSTNTLLMQTARQYIWGLSSGAIHGVYHGEVVKLLKSDVPEAQHTALSVIRHTHDKEFVSLAIAAANSKNEEVIKTASLVLSDQFSTEATNILISLSKHPNDRIRSRAALDLGDRRRDNALPVITGLLTDASSRVREMAARRLVLWFRYGEGLSSVPRLIEMLNDPDENVQMSAAASLGESDDLRAVEPLLKKLEDKPLNERVEYFVLQGLHGLHSPRRAASADSKVGSLFNSRFSVFVDILEKRRTGSLFAVDLVALSGNAEAVPVLEEVVKSHPDQGTRESAKSRLNQRKQGEGGASPSKFPNGQ